MPFALDRELEARGRPGDFPDLTGPDDVPLRTDLLILSEARQALEPVLSAGRGLEQAEDQRDRDPCADESGGRAVGHGVESPECCLETGLLQLVQQLHGSDKAAACERHGLWCWADRTFVAARRIWPTTRAYAYAPAGKQAPDTQHQALQGSGSGCSFPAHARPLPETSSCVRSALKHVTLCAAS